MIKQLICICAVALIVVSCQKKDKKTALYRGNINSEEVVLKRDKHTKFPELTVNYEGKWSLYGGNHSDSIDFQHPLLEGEGKGTFQIKTSNKQHTIFSFKTKESSMLVAETHLPMEGGFNFRDMGGIKAANGQYVKWGKVFRGDELGNLTSCDLEYLASIPILSIIDFRSNSEVQQMPDKFPLSIKNQFHLPIQAGNLTMDNLNMLKNPDFQGEKFMEELYIQLSEGSSIDRYKEFFDILQTTNNAPLIFHCTAGKDRTGMGAALFLFALGVDETEIMDNYLESNQYLQDKYAAYMESHPVLESLLTVKQQYLETGIKQIKKQYGSVEKYLTDMLGVDLELMRNMYLD